MAVKDNMVKSPPKGAVRFSLSLSEEQKKAKRMQDKFNQDIEELGEETDSLVEEIEKWQI